MRWTSRRPAEGRAAVATAWLAPAVATAVLAGACNDSEQAPARDVRIDMLAGGRVLVSNPDRGLHGDSGLRLVEEQRIGSAGGGGPDVFGDVFSLAADRHGVLYVADWGAEAVRVFDRDGSFLRRMGRQGDGPGEFSYAGPVGISWQAPNRLWVVDVPELALVDTAGAPLGVAFQGLAFANEVPRADAGGFAYVRRFEILTGNGGQGFVNVPVTYSAEKYALSSEGEVVAVGSLHLGNWIWKDRVVDHGDGFREHVTLPLQPDLVWAVTPGGNVWAADRTEYRLHELTFAGDTVRTVELRRDPVPLQGAERDSLAERFGFDPRDLPAHRLAMDRLDAGPDGLLWVRNTLPDGRHAWDVFNACGRYLGPVSLETRMDDSPFVATVGATLIGVTKDDLGVEHVVRLQLQLPNGERVPSSC